MTAQDFCYWLQGYMELENPTSINADRTEMIKEHLNLVFNSPPAINYILRRNNIKINSNRKYDLDESVFDNIDCEEKAYFLGLLYADGHNRENRGSVKLGLQERDISILDKFRLFLKSNKPIYISKPKNSNSQPECVVDISSKHISSNLSALGCPNNKSLKLTFPNSKIVPDSLISHFIRGYFDGDGCISIHKPKKRPGKKLSCFIIATNNFCTELQKIVKNKLGINSIIVDKSNNGITKSFQIGGSRQSITFFDFIYKNASVYIERKYRKYIEFKEYINNHV